jgi:hypothetical protein
MSADDNLVAAHLAAAIIQAQAIGDAAQPRRMASVKEAVDIYLDCLKVLRQEKVPEQN